MGHCQRLWRRFNWKENISLFRWKYFRLL